MRISSGYFLMLLSLFFISRSIAQNEKWTVFNRSRIVTSIVIDSNGNTWVSTDGCGIGKYSQTKWIIYNELNNGLSSDIVRCMVADRKNAIWVGTDNGICVIRNDTVVNAYELGNQVNVLTMDSAGNIWMGGKTGLKKFDGSTWTTVGNFSSNTYNLGISSIAFDSKGVIWMTYLNSSGPMGTLIKYSGSTRTDYNYSNTCIPNQYLRGLYIDKKDNKWFGSNSGLHFFSNSTCKSFTTSNSGLKHNSVMGIYPDSKGVKWIATLGGGIQKFNDTSWVTYNASNSGFSEDYIFTMTIDKKDVKWLGTMDFGVDVFRPDYTRNLKRFNASTPDDVITALAFDTLNACFVGTNRKMTRFDGKTWASYEVPNNGAPSPTNKVNDIIVEDKFNYKWVGTSYGGLGRFKSSFTQYDPGNSNIPSSKVTSIVLDSAGNKWMGTPSGLAKFTGSQWTTYYNIPPSMQLNATALAIDKKGHFWIANANGYNTFLGLVKYDKTNWIYFNPQNTGLPNYPAITSIACDDSGHVWFGINSYGLVKFDGTNWIVYNKNNSQLPEDLIRYVMVDSRDRVWAATTKGLVKIDGNNWKVYTTENSNIPVNNVLTIEEDRDSNIWIGTNGGGFARISTCNVNTNITIKGNEMKADSIAEFYQWVDCNNGYSEIKGANERIFRPTSSGNYAVIIKDLGCIDTSACHKITICNLNTSVTKNGYLLSAADTGASFQWMNCDSGKIIQNATSKTYTASKSGNYAVILTKGTCKDTSGCIAVTVCNINTAVNKNANQLSAAESGASYQWFNCDSNRVITGATAQSYTPSRTGNYSVIITKGACKDTSNCVAVTICNINVSVNRNGNQLSAVETGASYQWFDCDSNKNISGAVLQNYTPSRSGNYSVIITKGTCKDTSNCAAVTICSINASLNRSGNQLSAVETGASYQWFNCDSNKVIAGATAQSYTPSKTGNYSVIITKGTCKDTSSCAAVTICNINTSVNKSGNQLSAAETGASYQWFDCDSNKNISGAASQNYTPSRSGNYSVIITKGACKDTSNCVAVTICNINVSVNKNGNQLSAVETGASYQWFDCDSNKLIAGATAQSYTPSKTGNYSVIITKGTCRDTSGCIAFMKSQIFTVVMDGIQVYPNPATEFLMVLSPLDNEFRITDQTGKTIQSGFVQNGLNKILINTVAPGVYILNIGSFATRIVKIH